MLSAITTFLVSWGSKLGATIINYLIDAVNATIVALVAMIVLIAGTLPSGSSLPVLPSVPTSGFWSILIQSVNWFFPVSFIISVFSWVTVAIVAYVVIAPLARWAKLLR
jgi:hypothetical protein